MFGSCLLLLACLILFALHVQAWRAIQVLEDRSGGEGASARFVRFVPVVCCLPRAFTATPCTLDRCALDRYLSSG